MSWFYYVARAIAWLLVWLFIRFRVKGKENVPRGGPLMVVSNHLNLADPPLVAIGIGRRTMFMAKQELFRSKLAGYFIRNFGAFPVERRRADRRALADAKQVLAEGFVLVMFPEGSRSKTGNLQPAFPGVALIAYQSGVPILPVAITGSQSIKGLGWLLKRPGVTINIGTPFNPPPTNGEISRAELEGLTNEIMTRIAALLPEEYRGHYAAQEKTNVKG